MTKFNVEEFASFVALISMVATVAFGTEVLRGTSPPPVTGEPEQQALLDQLGEVVVIGEKPAKTTQKVINWLASLGGKFSFEGSVDLQGMGIPEDLKAVEGSANCVAFGLAPGINCELKVRWPEFRGPDGEPVLGGVSTLDPGFILYGIEPRSNGISYMIVDNKGMGEHAIGLLFNDTMVSRSPCVNVPVACERVVRITVEPNLQVVRMQIDLQRSSAKLVSFRFVMRRVPGSNADVVLGSPK